MTWVKELQTIPHNIKYYIFYHNNHHVTVPEEEPHCFQKDSNKSVLTMCQGLVVAVKEKRKGKHKVIIKWNEAYVRERGGDPAVTEEILLKTYWNKHHVKGWRLDLTS